LPDPGCQAAPGDTETVVLSHYRLAGICGIGLKPPDLIGAWGCAYCHNLCDGRANRNVLSMTYNEVRLYHAEAVLRTQAILIKEGKVSA